MECRLFPVEDMITHALAAAVSHKNRKQKCDTATQNVFAPFVIFCPSMGVSFNRNPHKFDKKLKETQEYEHNNPNQVFTRSSFLQ